MIESRSIGNVNNIVHLLATGTDENCERSASSRGSSEHRGRLHGLYTAAKRCAGLLLPHQASEEFSDAREFRRTGSDLFDRPSGMA